MANKPLHKFTVQESNNLQVYENYKCEVLTLSDAVAQTTATWDTPAKEVIIYSGVAADDDTITISLKVGGSHGDDIIISHDYLPFQVKGMLIEEVVIHGDSSTTQDDALTVLSFH